jgi:predicted ATPase/DNA-binding CsgD family transcriptional regulator
VTSLKRGGSLSLQLFYNYGQKNMNAILAQNGLSERETEIVNLLNDGLTNNEIADRTGLTLYTVKWYLKQIYSKLQVNNRTQAASKARELGLLNTKQPESKIRITSDIPIVLTPFFGRDTELLHIDNLLRDNSVRLMTLHGIGGMGKTRLALEVTRRFSSRFADGVFFVSLAQQSEDFLGNVASTLRLSTYSDDTLNELIAFLRNKECLIVLDNFEQFLPQVSHIVTLLERTKYLRILVTSREILHVRGEVVLPLEGLQTSQSNINIEENGAYQLYIQRARSGFVDFTPNRAEQATIVKICDLLGGMPLAIEIAAGWSSVLSVEETLPRLKSSLDLLASDDRDRPTRQQSIRATFDYSWDLLSSQAQQTLMSLGIFDASGFTFEVAEKIAEATPIIIKLLLDTALLQRAGDRRFGFHPLIRQYVNERLESDAELLEQVRVKHGIYYYEFVMRHINAFRNDLDLKIVKSFFHESMNLAKAWNFAIEYQRYDWLEAAAESGYLCEVMSFWKEADKLFEKTLKYIPLEQELLRGRLLAFRAIYAYRDHDLAIMKELALESWQILKDTEYAWDAGTALSYLAVAEAFLGNVDYGLEILNQVETLLSREDLPKNVYARGSIICARPTYLLYSGYSREAIEAMKQVQVPSWHAVNIRLPEAYIDLGMIDEARTALEKLYNAALDNGHYKSAVCAIFYLEVINSEPDMLVDNLVHSLLELCNINDDYPSIANLTYYLGTQLLMRGHPKWGRLLVFSTLCMLYKLDELPMMYQYALYISKTLSTLDYDISQKLLGSMINDPNCPSDLQQSALEQAVDRYEVRYDTVDTTFLGVVADLLLK